MVSVEELTSQAANMDEELSCLIKSVNEQRQKFHALNYFTTQQLLQIRCDLGKLKQDSTADVTPQLYSLLRSFSWQITVNEIKDFAVTVFALFNEQKANCENEDSEYDTPEIHENEIIEHINIENQEEESQPMNSEEDIYEDLKELIENLSEDKEEIFEQLCDYEYKEIVCYKAVQYAFSLHENASKDDLLDAAMDWCFDNANEYNQNENLKSDNTTELLQENELPQETKLPERNVQREVRKAAPKMIYSIRHPVVQELLKLDFPLELAIEGAKLCNGNFEQAAEWCLNAETEGDNSQQSLFTSGSSFKPVLKSDEASLPVR